MNIKINYLKIRLYHGTVYDIKLFNFQKQLNFKVSCITCQKVQRNNM